MFHCTLEECPPGLFLIGDTVCMKTEYGDNDGNIHAYIVSSGEFFVGGVADPIKRREMMVLPIEMTGFKSRQIETES